MDNNKLIIIGAILVLLIGGVILINVNITTDPVTTESDSNNQEGSVPTNKTDAEVILEGAKLAKETYDQLHENKLRKDSIRNANRKHVWVYQIGLPSSNNSKILEAYNKLSAFTNIKIFKASKKSYFIYKDDGYSHRFARKL